MINVAILVWKEVPSRQEQSILQFWLETDKAAYLLRQYFFNNLHDRLSTRPFLSLVEKKWLAFQLLYAVKQSHDNGVCHGDIKCENVLVTSWNWLYLADFASFKPTYIPHDDPSDFSFFFDTGGMRRCYLAPERLYEHGGEIQVSQDAPLRPSMDIFSVGCVIAELFLEGQPLFELSRLLAYRRGQFDPSQHLEKIPDSGIRKMILHMIQLDPDSRCSAESYLQTYAGVVLPCYFSPFLHNLYSNLNPINPDSRVRDPIKCLVNRNAMDQKIVFANQLKLKFAWLSVNNLNPMPMLTSLTVACTRLEDQHLNELNKCFPNLQVQVLELVAVRGLADPKIHLLNLKACRWVVFSSRPSLTLITPNLITLKIQCVMCPAIHIEAPMLSHFHLSIDAP
ncbi:hypothetical protein M8C21_008735 [Ambrosia artemisiifolia]|uniref:Protein kinase domain-containing protein n=1 Tax=Ambrosia artemisiifolia TaxID=4212 RepID=A0AAD5GWU2_AMBAR|nr:hypothetical protein M8C21_008735 [Ambrosia artemisiifolia]